MSKLKKYLVRIILFFLVKIFSIFINKPNNILLGSGFGKFTDNSKYLLLFLIKHNYNNVYYILDDKQEYLLLKDKYPVLYKRSITTFFKVIKAKYFFYTHNTTDIYPAYPMKAILINLWHGTAIKKMGFDSEVDMQWIRKRKKLCLRLPYEVMDYFVTASKNVNFIFESSMQIEKSKILPVGLPRNDFLFSNKSNSTLYNDLKTKIYKTKKKTILYAPTFRDELFGIKKVEELINYFSKLQKTNDFTIAIRMHPLESAKLESDLLQKNSILNLNDYDDMQEILLCTDILVTDYSSMIFDYAILERPILLYLYDFNTYRNSRGGFYFDYEKDFRGYGISHNLKEFEVTIKNVSDYQNSGFYKKYNIENASEKLLKKLRI